MKEKLSPTQITSLDEFGNRIGLHPAEVTGRFRKYRTWVQGFLILLFLGLPWIQINGYQSILLDIPRREFYFFGMLFRAHNAPLLLFLILGSALSLSFVTTVWGRVWCGWTCPQTVFIDGVFRRIEYFVEGNYLARRRQAVEPMTAISALKKILKWILFAAVAATITHSFLAYFGGAPLAIEFAMSALLTFNFGWFREQFCTIMCPYGRIQGLLLDSHSLAIIYDEKRNDCVNCNRCVNACPIGIDIRNGLQMECIACTACIDACDEIMEKVHKPKGLIKYGNIADRPIKLNARSALYLVGILFCASGLLYGFLTFQHSEAFILRSLTTPFTLQKENEQNFVTNQFRFHVTNQSKERQTYKITILNPTYAKITSQLSELTLENKSSFDWHFFVTLPQSSFYPPIKIRITDAKDSQKFHKDFEVQFLGPQL